MLVGTELNDLIEGTVNAELIEGLGGNDTLNGADGADSIYGGDGDDVIAGGAGSNLIFGGAGNDVITGSSLPETVFGGEGIDFYNVNLGQATTSINVNLNPIDSNGREINNLIYNGITVKQVEGMRLTTGSGVDTIVTNRTVATDDVISLGLGNDSADLTLNGSDIVRFGATGGDRVEFYENNTNADLGVNITILDSVADDAVFSSGLIKSGADSIEFFNVEVIRFSAIGQGDDRITTGGSRDIIEGGAGNDVIRSGRGQDSIYGGAGNDTLNSGHGSFDALYGGSGEDLFVFQKQNFLTDPEQIQGNHKAGSVYDFQNNIDTIRFVGFTGATYNETDLGCHINLLTFENAIYSIFVFNATAAQLANDVVFA